MFERRKRSWRFASHVASILVVATLSTACGSTPPAEAPAQQALYGSPYLRDGKAAIVRCADRSKYPTLADIDQPGVRVVANPGGTNADFDKANIHHATIVNYPDNNTIFDQLTSSNADVMITDASEICWQTKQTRNSRWLCRDYP
ncbi:MAG: periplasmic component of amino acid ABC-type transporter/signal transduction system [Mycobacterium sp.]|nr:periplasmic component of amino acid ABC-type transporter/signal transduction system [Mycobacterium sp.]